MFTQFVARSCPKIDFLFCPGVTNDAAPLAAENGNKGSDKEGQDAQDSAAQADNGKH